MTRVSSRFSFVRPERKGRTITDDPARRLLTAQHDERGVQDAGISSAELVQITKKKPARERLFLGPRFGAVSLRTTTLGLLVKKRALYPALGPALPISPSNAGLHLRLLRHYVDERPPGSQSE